MLILMEKLLCADICRIKIHGVRLQFGTCTRTVLMKQRLSSLRALIFMQHGNFDTVKVSVTFSCVRIFYFSRKLQSSNDLIIARFLQKVFEDLSVLVLLKLSNRGKIQSGQVEGGEMRCSSKQKFSGYRIPDTSHKFFIW